jgi:hypothetical protein
VISVFPKHFTVAAAAVLTAGALLSAPASALSIPAQHAAAGAHGAGQHISKVHTKRHHTHHQKYSAKRYRHHHVVEAPFTRVETGRRYRRGVIVDAPFAFVSVNRHGRTIRAPFVDLWIPR